MTMPTDGKGRGSHVQKLPSGKPIDPKPVDPTMGEVREMMVAEGLNPSNIRDIREFLSKNYPDIFSDPISDYDRAMSIL